MTALYLIQEIEKAGGKIQTENCKLKIKASVGIVSDTLKKQLAEHKAEIIQLLHVKRFDYLTESLSQKQKRAQGYGCAGCGCKTYQQILNGWECENCNAIFQIIGGSKGPVLIQ